MKNKINICNLRLLKLFLLVLLSCLPRLGFGQVASQALAPSVGNRLPSAAGFSFLNQSSQPRSGFSGTLGGNRYTGGGATQDDTIRWSEKGHGFYLNAGLGVLSMDVRTREKHSLLTRVKAGTVCGQIDGILNCSVSSLGRSLSQSLFHQHLDLALTLGPVAFGVRTGNERSQIEKQPLVKRSLTGSSVSLRVLGVLYLSSGQQVTKESPAGLPTYQWKDQINGAGVSFGGQSRFRIEIGSGTSHKASTRTATRSRQHQAERFKQLTAELKWGQLILGFEQKKIEIAQVSAGDPVPRSTLIRGFRGTWAYPKGFIFTFKKNRERYTMGTLGDHTEEGQLTTLSLGVSF